VDTPQISLIVPTINESENLPTLAGKIAQALAGRSYEILIVNFLSVLCSVNITPTECL
jgi:hypothetical protein